MRTRPTRQIGSARRGVTLLEVLTVVLIIGILAVMVVGVYDRQLRRARYAVARSDIRQISNACYRYEVDLGEYPPSSSADEAIPGPYAQIDPYFGNSMLYIALQYSMNGDRLNPANLRWQGPYLDFNDRKIQQYPTRAATTTTLNLDGPLMIIDPWGSPYHYVRAGTLNALTGQPSEYELYSATELPATSPFSQYETYINSKTFQMFSYGANATTFAVGGQLGLETDDVTNFEGARFDNAFVNRNP